MLGTSFTSNRRGRGMMKLSKRVEGRNMEKKGRPHSPRELVSGYNWATRGIGTAEMRRGEIGE
jgi:hypothetical protein